MANIANRWMIWGVSVTLPLESMRCINIEKWFMDPSRWWDTTHSKEVEHLKKLRLNLRWRIAFYFSTWCLWAVASPILWNLRSAKKWVWNRTTINKLYPKHFASFIPYLMYLAYSWISFRETYNAVNFFIIIQLKKTAASF